MNPLRIAIKLFVAPDPTVPVDLEPFTPLFHEFIQKASVPGLLIDVADYAHVPNGPGIILIGNEVDYGIDSVGDVVLAIAHGKHDRQSGGSRFRWRIRRTGRAARNLCR